MAAKGRVVKVKRAGETYEVRALGDKWDFWEKHFAVDWEESTRQTIEKYVRGGVYVDIGAWVGPTVLWGAKPAWRVIACEPDPIALEHLIYNVEENTDNVDIRPIAVSDETGWIDVHARGAFGDSMSSFYANGDSVTVFGMTISDLLLDDPEGIDLFKIDVEGAEGPIIKQAEPFLRKCGAPLLISLHPRWWPFSPIPYLHGWEVEAVDHETVLAVPR